MKHIITLLVLFASIGVKGQMYRRIMPDTAMLGKHDTAKCVFLVYQEGPLPLQVKGYVVSRYEWQFSDPSVMILPPVACWREIEYLDQDKRKLPATIWMKQQIKW